MSARLRELEYFYWYCAVAEQVISTLPANPATRSSSRHAVRMATLALAGKNGIGYASDDARRAQASMGTDWYRCRLVREHAIPVSVIHERVVHALAHPLAADEEAAAIERLRADMAAAGLDRQKIDAFNIKPRTWLVVCQVRSLTCLAWVTKQDETLLKTTVAKGSKSLHKTMPASWDGVDPLARYRACGLNVTPL